MAEWDTLQKRQLLESMAQLIDDIATKAHRLGLSEVVEILHEAQRAANREASGRHDAGSGARGHATTH